jgi:ankyrin repeat protein
MYYSDNRNDNREPSVIREWKESMRDVDVWEWEEYLDAIKKSDIAYIRNIKDDHAKDMSLLVAAGNGNIEVVKILLSIGANIYSVQEGYGVVGSAALNGKIEMVNFLLDNGGDSNDFRKTDSSPIMYAAAGGHLEIVKLLEQKGASIHDNDPFGKTTLDYCGDGCERVAVYLIESGARLARDRQSNCCHS